MISKIKNSEIHHFADDSQLAEWENIPISRYRAISYSKNPRSDPQDVVLYLAYIDGRLVGYRTIMPDLAFVGDTRIKVGWLSGNWVHNDFRRQGIASLLFDEACKDWGSRLLYTNYALESKAVYDKSGKFELLDVRKGRRFYLRSCFSTLLPARSSVFRKNVFALKGLDFLVNLVNPIPRIVRMMKLGASVDLEYLSHPDGEVFDLYEKECKSTLNRRTRTELQWILEYPWLVSSPLGDRFGAKYYFSSNPKRFSQSVIKVYRSGNLLGFLMLNLNDDKLSIPYCSFNSKDSGLMAKLVWLHAVRLKASMVTVYEPSLVDAMKQRWILRVFSKGRDQNYFATKELVHELGGDGVVFKDGDGDCAFI